MVADIHFLKMEYQESERSTGDSFVKHANNSVQKVLLLCKRIERFNGNRNGVESLRSAFTQGCK